MREKKDLRRGGRRWCHPEILPSLFEGSPGISSIIQSTVCHITLVGKEQIYMYLTIYKVVFSSTDPNPQNKSSSFICTLALQIMFFPSYRWKENSDISRSMNLE